MNRVKSHMRFAGKWGSTLKTVLPAVTLVFTPGSLYASVCPLCYGANSTQTIQALKNGILFLLFAPFIILGGVSYLAYQKRNEFEKNSKESRENCRADVKVGPARVSETEVRIFVR
jgi:hypothetical protein